MLTALIRHLGSAVPLPAGALAEAQTLAAALRGGDDDAARTDRLSALAVQWVIANPQPLPLPLPAYRR